MSLDHRLRRLEARVHALRATEQRLIDRALAAPQVIPGFPPERAAQCLQAQRAWLTANPSPTTEDLFMSPPLKEALCNGLRLGAGMMLRWYESDAAYEADMAAWEAAAHTDRDAATPASDQPSPPPPAAPPRSAPEAPGPANHPATAP